MFVYWALLLIPLFYYVVINRGIVCVPLSGDIENERRTNTIKIFFTIFIFLLAFRGISCGSDLSRYYSHFVRVQGLHFSEIVNEYPEEFLYFFLGKVIGSIFSNYNVYLFITAGLSLIPIAVFYCKESKMPILTLALFVTIAPFAMYFSGLRQGLAMAFVVPVWYYSKKRKIIPVVICVLIASFMHASAIVLAVVYPLYSLKVKKKLVWIILPVWAILLIFNTQILTFLMNNFGFIFNDRYELIISQTGGYSVLVLILFFVFLSFFLDDGEKKPNDYYALRNILIFALIIQSFVPINHIAMRMNYYFLLYIPVCVPCTLYYATTDQKRRIATGLALALSVFLLFMFFYKAYTDEDILNIYPYVWCFK